MYLAEANSEYFEFASIRNIVDQISFSRPSSWTAKDVLHSIECALEDNISLFDLLRRIKRGRVSPEEKRGSRIFLYQVGREFIAEEFRNRYHRDPKTVFYKDEEYVYLGESDTMVRVQRISTGERLFLTDTEMTDFLEAHYMENPKDTEESKRPDVFGAGDRFLGRIESKMGYTKGDSNFEVYELFSRTGALEKAIYSCPEETQSSSFDIMRQFHMYSTLVHINEDSELIAKIRKHIETHSPGIHYFYAQSVLDIIHFLQAYHECNYVETLETALKAATFFDEEEHEQDEFDEATYRRMEQGLKAPVLVMDLLKENPHGVHFIAAVNYYSKLMTMAQNTKIRVTDEMHRNLRELKEGKLPGHGPETVTPTAIRGFLWKALRQLECENGDLILARKKKIKRTIKNQRKGSPTDVNN